MRGFITTLAIGLVIFGAAALTAEAVVLDFTTIPFENKGSSFSVNSDLTLLARSLIPPGGDDFTGGVAGTIFVGELGQMNASVDAFNCPDARDKNCGVGVQSFDERKQKPKGSKGISGDGAHDDESLIFDFAFPVSESTLSVDLLGLNFSGSKTDVISLSIEFAAAPTQVFADVSSFMTPARPSNLGTLNFAALSLSGTDVTRFAIDVTEGHFGVAGLTYEPGSSRVVPRSGAVVPEPSSLLLLGSGLLGIMARRRARS